MSGRAEKLVVKFGITQTQGEALVVAGYKTARLCRAASDAALLAVQTIGERAVAKIRK